MSVRIYELSKTIGMTNQELIELLLERGYQVKSASSTVDNISAESLTEEFGAKPEGEPDAVEAPPEPKKAPEPPKPTLPDGVFVRSRADVENERRQKEEEKRKSAVIVNPTRPQAAAPSGPVSAPPSVTAPPNVPPPIPRKAAHTPIIRQGARPPSAPIPIPQKKAEPVEAEPEAAPNAPKPPTVNAPPVAAPPVVAPPKLAPPKAPVVSRPPIPPKPVAEEKAPVEEAPTSAEAAPAEEPAAPEKSAKKLKLRPPVIVRDFADQIGVKPFKLISELMEMNIFASMNQGIDETVAVQLASRHGYELELVHRGEATHVTKETKARKAAAAVAASAADEELDPRPPVICILGHVDHGKTTLLDTIRKTSVVTGEAGGITQHIGAYQVEQEDKKITFIDTPGHAAFAKMRQRGAEVTDIAILVVAADDGFMPQTDQALKFAQDAGVPIVVAINKIDAPGANLDKVKKQMQQRNIASEDWGGEVLTSSVSALKGEGIEDLLANVLLQAEVEDLRASAKGKAEGVIIESQKEVGIGATATVIIQRGTLKPGDAVVCGSSYCKVRTLLNDRSEKVKQATPAMPVKIVGWSDTPDSGGVFKVVKNEREAKNLAEEFELEAKKQAARATDDEPRATSIDDLFLEIAKTQTKVFRVVVKSDVYGTAEALASSLEEIKSEKIRLEVVETAVGPISRNDVLLSSAAGAAIVGFNINQENGVNSFAKHHNVSILRHNIIYELIDQIKEAMVDQLPPELKENKLGAAEVRQVFPLGKNRNVAGCMVTEGRINRDARARLLRKSEVIHESKIETLKRFKEDATEVRAGFECGIRIDQFDAYVEGDAIECFEILKIKPSL